MHSADMRRPHGFEAWVTNRVGHPLGRKLAERIWHHPSVQQWAGNNPDQARMIAEGLVGGTSMLELPGDHILIRLVNYTMEEFGNESLDLLEKMLADPSDPHPVAEMDAGIAKKLGDEVVIAVEHIHKDDKCLAVAQYVAHATPPARTGKDGKEIKSPSLATLHRIPLARALEQHKPFCGLCFPSVTFPRKPEEKKPSEPAAPREPLGFLKPIKQALKELFGDAGTQEREQFDQMIDGAGDILDKGVVAAKGISKKIDTALDERRDARERRRKRRNSSGLGRAFNLLVGPALLVGLALLVHILL